MSDKEEFLESENARLRSLLKQAGLDAAASDIGERLQRLLLSELHHRIKNMLSMVQSIVTQTLRSGHPSTEATEEAINRRIAALARTHDIIMSNAGDGAQLRGLVDEILAPFGASRPRSTFPRPKSHQGLPFLSPLCLTSSPPTQSNMERCQSPAVSPASTGGKTTPQMRS